MTTVDITLGLNNHKIENLELPIISLIELQSKNINVIKYLLASYENNSWLINAENTILKNGN